MTPAFKEWRVIVAALGAGAQILILRKGGIAEGRGGFQARADRFWLFPTDFHAQREKTKPTAAARFSAEPTSPALTHFAVVRRHVWLDDWARVQALDPFHFWTEATIRERFGRTQPPGLHAFVVRVHRLLAPLPLEPTPDMAGCKSWIDVPASFEAQPSAPVLADNVFENRVRELGLGY